MSGSRRAGGGRPCPMAALSLGRRKPDGICEVLKDNYQLSVLYPSLRSSYAKVRVREARPRGTDPLSHPARSPRGQTRETGSRVVGAGRGEGPGTRVRWGQSVRGGGGGGGCATVGTRFGPLSWALGLLRWDRRTDTHTGRCGPKQEAPLAGEQPEGLPAPPPTHREGPQKEAWESGWGRAHGGGRRMRKLGSWTRPPCFTRFQCFRI